MNIFSPAVLLMLQNLLRTEEGQDLVEYSMVFVMIALGTAASMQAVASAVCNVFLTVNTIIVDNV
ncbi:MAG TPA: hypothetical protein VMU48_10995 [Terracidiphilus sp.]|nr:hypothetical protein [Terracidiphilus sp.]